MIKHNQKIDDSKVDNAVNKLFDLQRKYSPKDSFEIVAWVAKWLLVKWVLYLDNEQEEIALHGRNEYKPLFPSKFKLPNWRDIPSKEVYPFLKELIRYWKSEQCTNSRIDKIRANINIDNLLYYKADNPRNKETLDWLCFWVGGIDFSKADEFIKAGQLLEKTFSFYENIAKQTEFTTPSLVTNLMVELANPQPGERVYDPCFGTGGFLVAMVRKIKSTVKLSQLGIFEGTVNQTVSGIEINPEVYAIGMARIILAGIPDPKIELNDALLHPTAFSKKNFDVILAAPPWGHIGSVTRNDDSLYSHFPISSNDRTNQFIQHTVQNLNAEGRAIVAVPEGTLFSSGSDKKLRKWLLEENLVEGVISLPAGTFAPYTNIKSNLLIIRKGKHRKEVRFMQVNALTRKSPKTKREIENPKSIRNRYFHEKQSRSLWNISIDILKNRNWELIAKRSGEEELSEKIANIQATNTDIEKVTLDKVADIITGIIYNKNSIVEGVKEKNYVPLVRISDIRNRKILPPKVFIIPQEKSKIKANQYLKLDDILLSISGTIGKVVLADSDPVIENYVAAKNLIIIRPNKNIEPMYLVAILQSKSYQKWLSGHSQGSTIQHLSSKKLRNLPICLPDISIQKQIGLECRRKSDIDAMEIFIDIITQTKDELNKWIVNTLESSDKLIPILDDRKELDPIIKLGRFGSELKKCWDAMYSDYPEELVSNHFWSEFAEQWIWYLEDIAGSLCNIDKVPVGTAQISMLLNAEKANEYIFNDMTLNEPATKRYDIVRLLYRFEIINDRLLTLLPRATIDHINAKNIDVAVIENINTINTTQIRLKNVGSFPVVEFKVETNPDIGSLGPIYFPEHGELNLECIIPKKQTSKQLKFFVNWHGYNVFGKKFNEKKEFTIEVKSPHKVITQPEIGTSPYITGSPIDRKEMFFGREDVLEKIRLQLSTSHRANIILLEGNRRSGKTSILNHISKTRMFPQWIPVYCTFQKGRGHDQKAGLPTDQIFKAIAVAIFKDTLKSGVITWFPHHEMPKSTGLSFQADFIKTATNIFSTEDSFDAFDFYLQSVLDSIHPKRLLLMLDEFDKIQEGIDTGVTSPQVPENIRALLHAYPNMTAILSYSKLLRRLREEYWSMLFGLGYPVSIGSLALTDAQLLVTKPTKNRLDYTEQARDRIVELCAGQPYLIQSLCNRIFEQASEEAQRTVSVSMVDKSAEYMSYDNEHFATLWQHHIGLERRRFILALCHKLSESPDSITRRLIEISLEESGVIIRRQKDLSDDLLHLRELELLKMEEVGSGYSLSIPLMGAWIRYNVDFEDQKRRAVEESEEQL